MGRHKKRETIWKLSLRRVAGNFMGKYTWSLRFASQTKGQINIHCFTWLMSCMDLDFEMRYENNILVGFD